MVKNVVLVHGAFADGSSWLGVVETLQANGFHVRAVQIPMTSLAADVAATKWVLDRQDGPTLLAGHSYGGVVISEAGIHANVVGLVYVAAMAPEPQESFSQVAGRFPTAPGGTTIEVREGWAQLSEAGFLANFSQDLSEVRARALAAVQVPISAGLFAEITSAAAWQNKPTWYQVSTMDRMIAPELQRFYAQRMRANTVELQTSHASPVTRPNEVASFITGAAQAL